jgi:single-strand DNA-binding protein
MSSVNHVHLLGRLGQDPEPRRGNGPCTLSVATSERWKDKNGEKKEATDWHRVVIFNERCAEFAEKYLKKGMMVWVVGKLKTRKYEKDGRTLYTTEVVLANFGGELQSLEAISGGGDRPPAASAEDYGYEPGGREPDAGGRSSLADSYEGPEGPGR